MITYNLNHVDGLFFELIEDGGKNREYDIQFVDRKDETNISKVNKEVRQIDDKDKTNKSQVNKEVNEEVNRAVKSV